MCRALVLVAAGVMSPVGAAETAPALERLTLGEVKPAGWLRDWCETAKDGQTRDMESVDIDYKLTLNPDYRPKTYYWQDLRDPKTKKRTCGETPDGRDACGPCVSGPMEHRSSP